MDDIKYSKFDDINPSDFLLFINHKKIRKHLIKHEQFNLESITTWIHSKIEIDNLQGCKVRGISLENELVGWCGIQLEDRRYEIAIIINDKFWGLGKQVFHDMMKWAKELGHKEVLIHFLESRPKYKFLNKISKSVTKTELLGRNFLTYKISVN